MDSSDWSSGIRHHVFDTRSDTEFRFNVRRYIERRLQFAYRLVDLDGDGLLVGRCMLTE